MRDLSVSRLGEVWRLEARERGFAAESGQGIFWSWGWDTPTKGIVLDASRLPHIEWFQSVFSGLQTFVQQRFYVES